ncbi:acetyltransferase [Robiginitalea sediminis]|uniref:acetyltransferase n=1 Tax=Robiginitalea sediminis TaxID=1982593 RepID=UPI000B4A5C2A|nr:acetyltransferase [Robiginitalea sediminis]
MKNILIFGASGHGSVVLDIVENEGLYTPVGFLDSFKETGSLVNGYPVLGTENDLVEIVTRFDVVGGIVAIGDNWVRRRIVHEILRIMPDFRFVRAIHPNAVLGRDVEIGEGTVVMPGVIVNANSRIGRHCILNTRCSLGHDGQMADYSSLAPMVCAGGNFRLGYCSAIGLGANIIENISIDQHSVVGAASLVIDPVPALSVAFGSPARVIRGREAGEAYLSGLNRKAMHAYGVTSGSKP